METGSYHSIIVVAGCERKCALIPDDLKVLCADYSQDMVRDPDERGLEQVKAQLWQLFHTQAN